MYINYLFIMVIHLQYHAIIILNHTVTVIFPYDFPLIDKKVNINTVYKASI